MNRAVQDYLKQIRRSLHKDHSVSRHIGRFAAPVATIPSKRRRLLSFRSNTPIPDWNFDNRQQIGETLVVKCVEATLTPSDVSPVHDLYVYADVVTLKGVFRLPERNVFIFARSVLADGSTEIDVSGRDGTPLRFIDHATDGQAPGNSGSDGKAGASGGNGGNIVIVAGSLQGQFLLECRGGHGGGGQDGGNGATGAPGANGADGDHINDGFNRGQPGFPGGAGGHGGTGGQGGNGGNAGDIKLLIRDELLRVRLDFGCDLGWSGVPGSGGKGAPGGPGGIGGLDLKVQIVDIHHSVTTVGREPSGAQGAYGSDGPQGPNGTDGTTAHLNPTIGTICSPSTSADFRGNASISQLLMTLAKAELEYISGNYDSSAERLIWLKQITETTSGQAASLPVSSTFSSSPGAQVSDDEFAALGRRADALLTQMSVGQDFYGLPRNFVTLVTPDTYKQSIDRMITQCTSIEGAYTLYWQLEQTAASKLDALNTAIASAQSFLQELAAQSDDIAREKNAAQDTVRTLGDSLVAQWAALQTLGDEFNQAVSRQAAGCSLLDVLACVATIVTAASNAVTAITGMLADVKKIGSAITLPDVIKDVRACVGDFSSLQQAYTSIKSQLTDVSANDAKIVVALDDFENTLKPYLNLQETIQYRDAMRTYVETARARNQKVTDYTGLILKQITIESEVTQKKAELVRLQDLLDATNDSELVECEVFMAKLLLDAKYGLIRSLYKLRRSIEYWSMSDIPFELENDTVSEIQSTYLTLLDQQLNLIEARNRAPQSFENVSVAFDADHFPEAFQTFRATGVLTFQLTPDNLAFAREWAAILIREVNIATDGLIQNGAQLSYTLTHSGVSTFINPDRQTVVYSHKPRTVIITRGADGTLETPITDNLGGDANTYADISPFSVWTLRCTSNGQIPQNMTSVSSVTFTFKGFFNPFSMPTKSNALPSQAPAKRLSRMRTLDVAQA